MSDGELAGYAGKTVFVTGGTGYLGSALVACLRQTTTASVVRVTRQPRWVEVSGPCLNADLQSEEGWREIVGRADIIFHLAGNTSVDEAARHPADSLRSTVLPLVHLTTAAGDLRRRPRVVFASTATVYGLADRLPVSEDAAPCPVTTYDLHKLWAEQHLALASRQGLLDGVSLRLANVYGPSPVQATSADRGVLNRMARSALRGEDLRLYGAGDYLRDYVYIDDVVQAFAMVGQDPRVNIGVFNVASGTGTTVRDAVCLLAERASQMTGMRSRVSGVPWPSTSEAIECRQFTASIDRIAATFGWRPTVVLREGLDRLLNQLLRNA